MSDNQMQKQRRNGLETRRRALSVVESELRARGYEVEFGAQRQSKIGVLSPNRRRFSIIVASLYRQNPWKLKMHPSPLDPDLFYVLAFVPEDGRNEFFIMTEGTTRELIRTDSERLHRQDDYPAPGITWDHGERQHLNAWGVLPK